MENLTGENLQKKLVRTRQSAWKGIKEETAIAINEYGEAYKRFLNQGKTERLCVEDICKLAEKSGFKSLEHFNKKLKAGDKVTVAFQNKTVLLFIIGKDHIENGLNIVGGHIDAPRLDLKPEPLYEETEMALLKTHYYGGIKKYQWVTIPLALYGVIFKKDGTKVTVAIGDHPEDPVFYISDLLPHLAQEQSNEKLPNIIKGEGLNVTFGSMPYDDTDIKEPFKLQALALLNEKYGIIEEDFLSAELEVVPAGVARDVGLDRSFIGAYGQDDRICAFAAAKALFDVEKIPQKTLCAILADKEEIGSVGSTGMNSHLFENAMAEIINGLNVENAELVLRRALANSNFLSADVTAGFDPNFPGTHDLKNAPYLGRGLVISKYGGSRGKSGSNDAHAEFLNQLRQCFNAADIKWQSGELGRIDLGGGGTIAYMLAKYGMNVVDCGPALLSMHSPMELSSKVDAYMTYKGYLSFYENI